MTLEGVLFRVPARLSSRSSVKSIVLWTSCFTSSDVLSTAIMVSSYGYKREGVTAETEKPFLKDQ